MEKMEVLKNSQNQIRQQINVSLSKMNKDVDEVKDTMTQVLEKLNMLKQHNKMPSQTAVLPRPAWFNPPWLNICKIE